MPSSVVLPPPLYAEVKTSIAYPRARSRRIASASHFTVGSSASRGKAVDTTRMRTAQLTRIITPNEAGLAKGHTVERARRAHCRLRRPLQILRELSASAARRLGVVGRSAAGLGDLGEWVRPDDPPVVEQFSVVGLVDALVQGPARVLRDEPRALYPR